MNTLNLSKEKKLKIMGILVMLVGVVLAFCSKDILIDSTIFDGNTGIVPLGISFHVVVIFVITLVSAFLLYRANIASSTHVLSQKQSVIFHGLYLIAGLFFSIATGYSGRSQLLLDYLKYVHTLPYWYSQDIINARGFDTIPNIAQNFSSTANVFYMLTIISIITLIAYYINCVEEFKNKILALIGMK